MTEQLAAKELAVSPKSYILRESVNQSSKLLFDHDLMLPSEVLQDEIEDGLFFDAVEKV